MFLQIHFKQERKMHPNNSAPQKRQKLNASKYFRQPQSSHFMVEISEQALQWLHRTKNTEPYRIGPEK